MDKISPTSKKLNKADGFKEPGHHHITTPSQLEGKVWGMHNKEKKFQYGKPEHHNQSYTYGTTK